MSQWCIIYCLCIANWLRWASQTPPPVVALTNRIMADRIKLAGGNLVVCSANTFMAGGIVLANFMWVQPKESRATLTCLSELQGDFYMLQLISLASRHFTQPEYCREWTTSWSGVTHPCRGGPLEFLLRTDTLQFPFPSISKNIPKGKVAKRCQRWGPYLEKLIIFQLKRAFVVSHMGNI